MVNLTAGTEPIGRSDQLRRDFRETLAACSRQIDAFHLAVQAALHLGAEKCAICIPDPARENRLVVRLSAGMIEASNRLLVPATPRPAAALAAFARNQTVAVANYAVSEYAPTDLEERQAITAAAHIPLRSPGHAGAHGILMAVPPAALPFGSDSLRALSDIADDLGASLERLSALRPAAPDAPEIIAARLPGGLFDAFSLCLNAPDMEALSDQVLEQCRRFTGSEFGFAGYLEPANGFLICPTMTRGIFAQCQVAGKTVVFEKAGGLGGWVLDHRTPLIANDPPAHPASVGTPPGHLPIRKFMGVPCFSRGAQVGMIALANKDSDYVDEDLRLVSAFAEIYGAGIARFLSERELTLSRNRYSSLYEEAPCGYQTLAPDGTIQEINGTALQLLGRTREEIVGRVTITDLLTTTGKTLFLDQLSELKRGAPAAPVELHLRRPDGSRIPALQSVTAVTDDRGYLQAIRCTLVDISLRKMLRQTRDSLETMFNFSSSPMMVLSPQLRITRFNPAFEQLTGWPVDAVLGEGITLLLPDDRREEVMARLQSVLAGERLESAEIPIRSREGAIHTVLWNSSNFFSEDGTELLATVIQGVDITDRKRAELALSKTVRALTTLSRGNEALVHASTEQELVQRVCDILVEVGGYRLAWIGYAEHDEAKTIRPVARAGPESDYVERIKVTWDDSPTGRGPGGTSIRTASPQVFQDILNDPRFHPWRAEAVKRGYACNAAIPLISAGEVLGMLGLYGAQPNAFDEDEMRLMTELAGDLAYGITALRTRAEHITLEAEREHYLQHLKESMQGTVQAIAATIEKRDPYTAGHQQRVARLAVAIAGEMGLDAHQIEGVHFGGLIHDIGKISIPAEILSKPGRLDGVEYKLIQAHAAAGREILKGVRFPWPIIDMVYQHHERMDGSGYPQGLKGDAIRLEARILAVADVVEAMSSFRPYRPAVGTGKALEEIRANGGRLYDAAVVAACLRLFEKGFEMGV